MPKWLEEKKAEYARTAQLRLCKHCGAPILRGLDADIAALKVDIDPTPITETGEALALLQGRGTYELHRSRHGPTICHRAEWNISAPRRRPVYPAHRCGQGLADHTDTTAWRSTAPAALVDPNIPPF